MTQLEELKAKVETLQAAVEENQPLLAKSLSDLEAADDENREAIEAKVNELSNEIDALRKSAQIAYDNYNRLTPTKFNFETKSAQVGGVDVGKLEEMLANLEVKTANEPTVARKSPGQYIGDYFKAQGIYSEMDWNSKIGNRVVPFYFNLGESEESSNELKTANSVKSLYTNFGEVFVSGSAIPGFQGYACSIFEVDQECQICIRPTTFGDFLTTRPMPTGSVIQYDYPVSRTDNATGVLETIYNPYPTKVQNGRKPESTFTYGTAKVKVSKIAHFITASDEVLDDCSKVAARIDYHLTSGLLRERDRQLIAGSGTAGQVLGLLNQPGLLALDGTVLTAGIDFPNSWDKLYMAMLELEATCARVDGVIINPADRSKVALAKDANGNYLFPQETNCDVTRVGCMELRTSVDVPVGTVIIGEFRNNWVWYARQNLVISVGMTGDQFIENTKTFLAELRGGTVVFCPNKIAIMTNF